MERRRPAAVAVLPPSASAEARPAAGSFLPPLTSPHERTEGDRGDAAAAAAAAAAAGAGLVATSKRRSAGLQARTSAQVGGARKSQDEQAKAKEAHAKARWNHAQVCAPPTTAQRDTHVLELTLPFEHRTFVVLSTWGCQWTCETAAETRC